MRRKMEPGDLMMIHLDQFGIENCPMLIKYNGKVAMVTRVKRFRYKTEVRLMVQLDGVESPKGIPYSLVDEWLVKKA